MRKWFSKLGKKSSPSLRCHELMGQNSFVLVCTEMSAPSFEEGTTPGVQYVVGFSCFVSS